MPSTRCRSEGYHHPCRVSLRRTRSCHPPRDPLFLSDSGHIMFLVAYPGIHTVVRSLVPPQVPHRRALHRLGGSDTQPASQSWLSGASQDYTHALACRHVSHSCGCEAPLRISARHHNGTQALSQLTEAQGQLEYNHNLDIQMPFIPIYRMQKAPLTMQAFQLPPPPRPHSP